MTSSQKLLLGIILVPVVIALLVIAAVQWRASERRAEQQQQAEALFEPAREALAAVEPPEQVDVDKTIRVIHALELAVAEQDNLEQLLQTVARVDYRGVAPEVLQAREQILDVLMKLYAQQTQLENQQETFTVTRGVLSAMSLMKVDLGTATGAPPGLDAEQARSILADLRQQQSKREELRNGLAELEAELIEAMVDYSAVYYKWVGEWDKVVVLRDRAYLAAAAGNWGAVLSAAREARELAPLETEAHLLEALALIESASTAEDDRLTTAMDLLNDYVEQHPDRSAPALLLRGVAAARAGQFDEAKLSFEQSSAYYPRQVDALTDMLNPYEARSYLRGSREGQRIVDLYRSTMLGAGAFSPDLQHARMLYQRGDVEAANAKVLDHFSRRRNQNRWDLILADVEFCTQFFGAHFDELYLEDSHLFLEVKPTLLGSKLDVRVRNGADRKLYNATLLLAVRFTDMHRDDFEVFKAGDTVPVVEANDVTSFGTVEIAQTFLGAKKTVNDIVVHRAIIVADDAVAWVDTDEYRLAIARTERASEEVRTAWFEQMRTSPQQLSDGIARHTDVGLDLKFGTDDVAFTLPSELSRLNPVFRLRHGDNEVAPATNTLNRDGIQLKFGSVANFDDATTNRDAILVVSSRWGEFEVALDLGDKRVKSVDFRQ